MKLIYHLLSGIALVVSSMLLYHMVTRGLQNPPPPQTPWLWTDLITILLTAIAVILAALAIFLALLGIVGYQKIQEMAKSAAVQKASDIARAEAERVAREVSPAVAAREAEAYMKSAARARAGSGPDRADSLAGELASVGAEDGTRS